jgi:hypothetical protein
MDTNARRKLPWDQLKRTEGDIPWEALEQFARAAVADKEVIEGLLGLFEESAETYEERRSFECLYISAILAMAGPDLSDAGRNRVARFLVRSMLDAADTGDEALADVLPAAIGTLGPEVVLPAVLEFMPADFAPWEVTLGLWKVASLARQARDAGLRERVVALCTEALGRAESGAIELHEVEPAAWALARIGETASRPLLQGLLDKSQSPEEIQDSLYILDGKLDLLPEEEPWTRPVRQWVTEHREITRLWYAEIDGDLDAVEDDDEDADERRARQLAHEFAESPVPAGISPEVWEDAASVACFLLDYAWSYERARPEDLTEQVLREVLLELFPRKVTADREFFERVSPLVQAFLDWLQARGILAGAAPLRDAVAQWSDQIVSRGMDRRYWGMGKGFSMAATEQGYDLTDRQGMMRFMAEYNQQIRPPQRPGRYEPEAAGEPVPAPIVNEQPKVGRNDPCPCGSGKKYKKCCGR